MAMETRHIKQFEHSFGWREGTVVSWSRRLGVHEGEAIKLLINAKGDEAKIIHTFESETWWKHYEAYPAVFKLAMIEECLEGSQTHRELCKRYGVNLGTFRQWLRKYRELGTESLKDGPGCPGGRRTKDLCVTPST
jgi:hypothetical protein